MYRGERESTSKVYKKNERGLELLSALEELRQQNVACDFIVTVEGKSFPVHRLILIASSGYFRAMLFHNMKEAQESRVDLKNMQAVTFEQCLNYMYNGEFEISAETAQALIDAGTLLQLEEFRQTGFKYLESYLSVEDCFEIKALAEVYGSAPLLQAAEKFIAYHLDELNATKDFKLLQSADVKRYLQPTNHSEKVKWEAIANWINHDLDARKNCLIELLSCTEKKDFLLTEALWHDPLVQTSCECQDYIAKHVFENAKSFASINESTWSVMGKLLYSHQMEPVVTSNVKYWKETLFNFMVSAFSRISVTPQFTELPNDVLDEMLQSSIVKSVPKEAWNAIVSWTNADIDDRKNNFPKFFDLINLDIVSEKFLEDTVGTNELVQAFDTCKNRVATLLCARSKSLVGFNLVVLDKRLGKLHIFNPSDASVNQVSTRTDLTGGKIINLDDELYVLKRSNLWRSMEGGKWVLLKPDGKNEFRSLLNMDNNRTKRKRRINMTRFDESVSVSHFRRKALRFLRRQYIGVRQRPKQLGTQTVGFPSQSGCQHLCL